MDSAADNRGNSEAEDHLSSHQDEGNRGVNWSITITWKTGNKSSNQEKRNEDQKCVSPALSVEFR